MWFLFKNNNIMLNYHLISVNRNVKNYNNCWKSLYNGIFKTNVNKIVIVNLSMIEAQYDELTTIPSIEYN